MHMISIGGLSFQYPGGEPLFDDFRLEVATGDLFGLVGPNGAGKSTLISLMCGLRKPHAGGIRIGDRDLSSDRTQVLENIALVPQDYAFYPKLSGRENLEFFAQLYPGLKRPLKRVEEVLELAGISGFAHRRASTYSGGMKRRLNLAIGLLNRPALLILDEPTVGIDPQSRNFLLQSIRKINRDGTTVLYTSHLMEEVEQMCNRVAILDHGKILVQGALDEMLSDRIRFRAELASAGTSLNGKISKVLERYPLCLSDHTLVGTLDETSQCIDILNELRSAGIALEGLTIGRQSLEALFFDLTHKDLRE
ncbi:MAG: ABC transporter ATP-binding protein [Acidiferrobacteraceae bacterium]|jgi:ABC-2 type transport system ATP-binding protein